MLPINPPTRTNIGLPALIPPSLVFLSLLYEEKVRVLAFSNLFLLIFILTFSLSLKLKRLDITLG